MRLRVMTADDIPGGVRLNTLAGWNQTEADWARFLNASPTGCFVMDDGATVVGTATTLAYEGRFAWIGMVLVDPEYRNQGIGTELLERAIGHLDGAGIPTIKLDATPQGKPLYEKLGFVNEYEIERWVLKRTHGDERKRNAARSNVERFLGVFTEDREAFGADRSELLRSLAEQAPGYALTTENDAQLQGYTFGRRGLFADHLGPWMARDRDAAERLLTEFLKRSTRSTVIVDALKSNPSVGEILLQNGFTIARPLTRMYRGANEFPGKPELLCGIVGPEFG